ncbi:MAG: short-chain dehydrogenase/reductase [Candidatus Saccharibacteria bacterium]|nr:short-chain dehydrogenase/reductase [Candidatus Saccharibacteria bacterium]
MERLKDKVAIITGAAAGIGWGIAERFVSEGASVIAFDINEQGLNDLKTHIQTSGGDIDCMHVDITDEAAVKNCVEEVSAQYGRIDILVNDAAKFVLKGIEANPDDWQESFSVNVFGAANCTKYVSAVMVQQGSGAIVNLASISGVVAQPLLITYSASKAAIIQMTKNLALDLGKDGIRVNCISPGAIITSASERHAAKLNITLDEFIKNESKNTVINKVGSPADVACAALFLASDDAGFITGANLMVDGGYTIV